ncbi:MAG: hypothetical protein HQL80_06035 [Magnetococcales bacterium]|nr:hypothetical protein [Magnetococcales bacterium]MBF0583781.1 hypothetical protein [Magnetococcales bacterium]
MMEAEQKLWVAVLETALNDALAGDNPSRMETARRWFREGGQNFKLVCDLANFDASFVRKKILTVIDQESNASAKGRKRTERSLEVSLSA